jgi:hypothetical protein
MPQPVDASFFYELSQAGLPELKQILKSESVPQNLKLYPWGWTSDLRQWADENSLKFHAPQQAAVRAVNSRRFSFQLEREWNVALPGSAAVTSLDELKAAVQNLPEEFDRWVIKAEFSMSARERVLGNGREISVNVRNWTSRRLGTNGVVFFEPWVDRIEEAGLQFSIPEQGEVEFLGKTTLLTDQAGGYRGSRFSSAQNLQGDWAQAVETGFAVASRLQAAGYFGPLGIDALSYRDASGRACFRPIQDINARYTMGRIALGFRRLLNPGETASWLQVSQKFTNTAEALCWKEEIQEKVSESIRILWTSPVEMGSRPVQQQTVLLIGQQESELNEAEKILFES